LCQDWHSNGKNGTNGTIMSISVNGDNGDNCDNGVDDDPLAIQWRQWHHCLNGNGIIGTNGII
jgi:hypothetical protein